MRSRILVASAAIFAGCTRPVAPAEGGFDRETAGRIAGPAQTCVSTYPSENLRVLDAQTLAYGSGREIYINRLSAPCPGLGELNTTIVLASMGSRYCRGDRVRGLEVGATIPGPTCVLADWVPYRKP